MAENTNYIGVAMGLDVSDLRAGLTEANRQIQLANSEFKAASSGMDDWTKSTEGLTAKVKQLDSVLKAQKSKLAGLQAEYDRVAKEQGENSEAARKLQVQINNQQAVVNKTEKEFKNYSETLKQVEAGTLDLETASLRGGKAVSSMGDGAKDAGGKMGGFAGIAGGVIGVVAGLGAAVVGAVGGFLSLGESTRELRENMNKLETGFTTAKHSAEDAQTTYRDLYGILGDEGQATEAAAHLAQLTNDQKDLSKWTNISAGVYATFGDSLPIENLAEASNETAKTGKITGGLADALNWAGVSEDEFQAKLDAASTEQERQALITETLNGLYSEQAKTFKELNKDIIEAREADAALSQAMADLGAIAEPIMTSLKMLAVDLLENIKPFVQLIGEGLKGVLDGTAGSADKLGEGLGGLFDVLADKAQELLPKIIEIILQLIPKIGSAILGALPQLLQVLVSLVMMILEQFPMLYEKIYSAILEVLPILIEKILSLLPTLIQSVFDFVMTTIGTVLPNLINQILTMLPSLITSIIDGIVAAIPVLIQAVIDLLILLVQDVLPNLIAEITTALPKVINSIIDGLLAAIPQILESAITLLMAIIDAIPVLVKVLYREVPKLAVSIVTSLLSKIPDIAVAAFKLLFAIIEAVPKIALELIKAIPEIYTAAYDGLMEGVPEMAEAGLEMLKGIWEGIKDGKDWLKEKITGFAGDVAGWFKKTFKINSPSKLIEDEVGVYVGQAVVPSSPSAMRQVKKRLSNFTDYVSNNLGNIKAGLDIGTGTAAGAVAGAGAKNVTIDARQSVHYNGKMSRKEIKRLQQDQYVNIKTQLAGEGAI